jgi:RNA polymerase sigma factor (TIGR02999 family)
MDGGGDQGSGEVTRLLRDVDGGSKAALDELFALLYDRLRGMSHRFLAAHLRSATLSTTALVHEAYVKLSRDHGWTARDREHFLSISARAMRQIVVDAARARGADKRGAGVRLAALSGAEPEREAGPHEILAIDRAIAKLERVDPELARLIDLRYFAGLSLEEIRELTGTPERTQKRRFRAARALLVEELGLSAREPAETGPGA